MPSANRRVFLEKKIKYEYRQCRSETNREKIAFLIRFAEVSVDNAKAHVSLPGRRC